MVTVVTMAKIDIIIVKRRQLLETPISVSNVTYRPTIFAKSSFGLSADNKDTDLPLLHWFAKLRKGLYKQRFIAGSSGCPTKPQTSL